MRRQVDSNWYEGERNAMVGIFPVTYVEIIPGADPSVTPLGTLKSMKSGTGSAVGSINTYIQEGQGKAKFNFQVISGFNVCRCFILQMNTVVSIVLLYILHTPYNLYRHKLLWNYRW